MLFQLYGDGTIYKLIGWVLVFAGLVICNELARRSDNVLGIVPPGHAQVELVKGRLAHAPQPGGEAMGHATGGREGVGGVEHDTLMILLGE